MFCHGFKQNAVVRLVYRLDWRWRGNGRSTNASVRLRDRSGSVYSNIFILRTRVSRATSHHSNVKYIEGRQRFRWQGWLDNFFSIITSRFSGDKTSSWAVVALSLVYELLSANSVLEKSFPLTASLPEGTSASPKSIKGLGQRKKYRQNFQCSFQEPHRQNQNTCSLYFRQTQGKSTF